MFGAKNCGELSWNKDNGFTVSMTRISRLRGLSARLPAFHAVQCAGHIRRLAGSSQTPVHADDLLGRPKTVAASLFLTRPSSWGGKEQKVLALV